MAGEMIARAILDGDDRWRLFSSYELVWAGGKFGRAAAQAAYWSMQARDGIKERISRYRDSARRESEARQARWAAENAARRAEAEARRAAEEAKRIADAEARRLAAEEARRVAAENARLAKEEVERIRQERVRAAEEAKRAEEEAARAAAAQALQDAAEAAATLGRQIEEHKALTGAPGTEPATAADARPSLVNETAPTADAGRGAEPKDGRPRKLRAARKKKKIAEPLPPEV
jgi:membrane protein involved in colicin uptake